MTFDIMLQRDKNVLLYDHILLNTGSSESSKLFNSSIKESSIEKPLEHLRYPCSFSIECNNIQDPYIFNQLNDSGYMKLENLINHESLKSLNCELRQQLNKYTFTKPEVLHDDTKYVIMHDKGRIDYSPILLNFEIPVIINEIIQKVIRTTSRLKTIGLLSLNAQTHTYGRWHRDTPQLFKYSIYDSVDDLIINDYQNIRLPDYYYTVFIPCTNITRNNGPTEVIAGSHKISVIEAKRKMGINRNYLICNVGDVIIMNGKLLHRSTPNFTDNNRDIIYLVYSAPWFDESSIKES